MSWYRHEYFDSLTEDLLSVEIVPMGDSRAHNSSEECDCIPLLTERDRILTLIHNSFDGRESLEKNERGH